MCIWSHLDYCLLTDHLFGLIIIMQLIVLSFYKKKLSELTFRHATLTLVVCSKKVSLWNSEVNLENTLFVSKSIIYLLPFLFNDWCLFSFLFEHNYETSWSSIGNFDKPSYKTNFYRKNYILINVQLILGKSNWREFKIYLISENSVRSVFYKVLKWIVNFQIFQIDTSWLSDSNGIRTHNHLVRKWTLSHSII